MIEALIQLPSLWAMSLVALCIVHESTSATLFFIFFSSFFFTRFSGAIRRGCPFASRGLFYLAAGLFPATLVAAAPTPGAEVALTMPTNTMNIKEVAVLVKRLPVLTQANFLDWNLAFQLFAVSLGLGAILWPGLYMVADTDDASDSSSSSSSSTVRTRSKAAEIVVEDKNVDYAPVSRNTVSRQPTSDDEAQALRYAYTVLMSTVSLTLLSRVRLFPGR